MYICVYIYMYIFVNDTCASSQNNEFKKMQKRKFYFLRTECNKNNVVSTVIL